MYAAMTAAHPGVYKPQAHFRIDARLLRDQINAEASTVLWLLFGASGLLFVIACSNVANLILARTVRRESELALRTALGASSAAIRRSLLAEALVLCGSGGLAGVAVAVPMVTVLARYALRYSIRAADLNVDFSVLWMGLALALVAAVFLALVPRLPSTDTSRGLGLNGGSGRITGSSRRRIRAFTVTQIAASFLLLASAGALLKTLLSLQNAQAGFETGHVLIANLPLIPDGRTMQRAAQFYQETQRIVSGLPGVEGAATSFMAPWRDTGMLKFTLQFAVEGRTGDGGKEDLRARFRSVSPGYFATLGIPLLDGRDFTEADRRDTEPVSIVSQSVAQRLFPGQAAVNRHILWTDPMLKYAAGMISPDPQRIVGGRCEHHPRTEPDDLRTLRAGTDIRGLPGCARKERPLRPPHRHHKDHSRRGCHSARRACRHATGGPHRNSGEQPCECRRVRRVRCPRTGHFRDRSYRRAGLFGKLAHARVWDAARAGRPAAPDPGRSADRRRHDCRHWHCIRRPGGLGPVPSGRQLRSRAPTSRAASADRIGGNHPLVRSPGVSGAGGEGCSCGHRSSASRGMRRTPPSRPSVANPRGALDRLFLRAR